jgi:hypothetical protein
MQARVREREIERKSERKRKRAREGESPAYTRSHPTRSWRRSGETTLTFNWKKLTPTACFITMGLFEGEEGVFLKEKRWRIRGRGSLYKVSVSIRNAAREGTSKHGNYFSHT